MEELEVPRGCCLGALFMIEMGELVVWKPDTFHYRFGPIQFEIAAWAPAFAGATI